MAKITASKPVIELRCLKKRFGIGDAETQALDGIDLTVKKGEFIVVMGPSGCGKTTLLNIIGLLDSVSDGDYLLDGMQVEKLSNRKHAHIRANQIGFVFQNFNLIENMNVIENVALPLSYSGVRRIKRLTTASKTLELFHLHEREYYMPWQLSGGQTQRVAIARALINNPSLILADEPTGNLDSKSSHIIMEEFADIHKRGNTIIMVTHNPSLATYATRVITMLDGKIDTDTKDIKPKKRLTNTAHKRPLGKTKKKASKPQKTKPKKEKDS